MGDRDSAERKAAQRVDEANALGHDRQISTVSTRTAVDWRNRRTTA
jgi:hypothetical protein